MLIETINPATGLTLCRYETHSQKTAYEIIEQSHHDYLDYRQTDFAHRAQLLRRVASLLLERKQTYAQLMSTEMGKPVTQAQAEIEKCALVCHHYADNAADYLQTRHIVTEHQKSYVCYQPLGLVFAIMPWNFPFWQVFRFACPTLMAGNGALLKHAPISTGAGLAIEQLFRDAGFPKHLFRTLVLDDKVAATVIENPKVIAVTLTGSEQAGRAVGQCAAKNLKKIVLELGGNDAYVVCDDANLALAAEQIVSSRMNNAGQVCIAAKRVIAVNGVLEKLIERCKSKLARYQIRSPLDETCQFGPLARADLRDTLHAQVSQSIQQGATLLEGGQLPEGPGFYYPPTMLRDVTPGMCAFDEELFGPVLCFIEAQSEADAIRLANLSKYGLGAAVFTQDIKKGERIAREELQAGACFVNGLVRSNPNLPCGGIKNSGYGRELSAEGIREFVNIKSVVVKQDY